MLELPDAWTWDFWLADTGSEYHVFYLKASRALLDPARRHRHASVGHARSTNLTNCTELADALVPSDPVAWDDLATWTGSVLRGPDGVWRTYYTGLSHSDDGQVQSIGMARSSDMTSWQRAEEANAASSRSSLVRVARPRRLARGDMA
jgi:beta-fructofuranosidase